MKTNSKRLGTDFRMDTSARLAGGAGLASARQGPLALLRRSVLAYLLWEDLFYEDGKSVVKNIQDLVPQVEPQDVFNLAVEARMDQKLRHVPLFLAREMARHLSHRHLVGQLLPIIIQRPDEIMEFLSIYWKDKRVPIANQVHDGLAASFANFDEYQFAKWRGKGKQITLQDVERLVHPKPVTQEQERLYRAIREDSLKTPDTWEVALSGGEGKKEAFTRLIKTNKLPALALLKNLRNMQEAGVSDSLIREALSNANPRWLLPINFLTAVAITPAFEREIETLMFKCLANYPKLPGMTYMYVDESGSMNAQLSESSRFTRKDVAMALAMLASEVCEHIRVFATAGDDWRSQHATVEVPPRRGFGLVAALKAVNTQIGGGGIFTRQALEATKPHNPTDYPRRIFVLSDSQDMDRKNRVPDPSFAQFRYLCDISAHSRGVNYKGVWTAEISGWSENYLRYVAAIEGLNAGVEEDEDSQD